MVRKRLDDRVRTLLELGMATGQRSMLVLVGDHGKDQVPNLYQILTKASPLVYSRKVLWCYKKDLGFSTHRKKRMKKLQRDKDRGLLTDTDNAFELFLTQTDINWCYYKDSHRVLGTTNQVLVLQDFEALTPNLMARTIETVQGGGLVVFLLRTVQSLKQLYVQTMDVHARYRTEASGDVVPRFNERFILSWGDCRNCLVCDDELNVLPLSKKTLSSLSAEKTWQKGEAGEVIVDDSETDVELRELKESLIDTPHVGVLVDLSKTLDQAKALVVFLNACAEKGTTKRTVAMTAARGRGKSATMGLCLAGAIALGYSNIVVTAPEPENLVAVFAFVCRGLKVLQYQEHADYKISYNTASGRDQTKCITGIHLHRSHRQVIQYFPPDQIDKFSSTEIVAIDEAAAIPLPIVRKLVTQSHDRLSFLSSTINGYEGTGRALSLKLIKELREAKGSKKAKLDAASLAASAIVGPKQGKGDAKVHEQRWAAAAEAASGSDLSSGSLYEIELVTPIRYAPGDKLESWLNKLLCMDSTSSANLKLVGGAPAPSTCELYSVNRDALFSYHTLSEAFLQKIMGLYTSAHYKNTPNDLQLLSDAPGHSLFVLLSPNAEQDDSSLPDVLAVIQVATEGKISRKAVEAQLSRGNRSAGDLIPWTLSQQFGDSKFAQLSGARIVRIAVHPSVQSMGYGSESIDQLFRFYNGDMVSLGNDEDEENESNVERNESDDDQSPAGINGEKLKPRAELPPLLLPLTEVDSPRLDWIGTSFGLTLPLHKFWTRCGLSLLYLRQTQNQLTGEHTAIMVRTLSGTTSFASSWLPAFAGDTQRRVISLFAGPFREVDIRLAVSLLDGLSKSCSSGGKEEGRLGRGQQPLKADELDGILTPYDLRRLELYGRNLCDHHLVTDLLPIVAQLFFSGRLDENLSLSAVQSALLCGIGLQHRQVDSLTKELELPANQVLAMFNKAVRKISMALNSIVEAKEKEGMLHGEKLKEAKERALSIRDVSKTTLDEDARESAKEAMEALEQSNSRMTLPPEIAENAELMQYQVKGSNEQWDQALQGKSMNESSTVQIQSSRPKRKAEEGDTTEDLIAKYSKQEGKTKKSKKKSKRK